MTWPMLVRGYTSALPKVGPYCEQGRRVTSQRAEGSFTDPRLPNSLTLGARLHLSAITAAPGVLYLDAISQCVREKRGIMQTLVKSLVLAFVKAAGELQARRFELGDTVLRLWEATSKAETTRLLKAAMPDAKEVLGFAITTKRLEELATMAETFKANGGIIHGAHRLTREDIQSLGLTTSEAARLTDLLKGGKVRIKSVKRQAQRIANDAEGVNGKSGSKAREVIRGMLTNGDDVAKATESIDAKRERLARLLKRIEDLTKQKAALEAEITKAQEAPKVKAQQRRREQQRETPRHLSA